LSASASLLSPGQRSQLELFERHAHVSLMRLLSATDASVQQVALVSLLYLSDCPLFVPTFAELAIVEPLLTLTCGAAQSSQVLTFVFRERLV
jgi:hypothetical protein